MIKEEEEEGWKEKRRRRKRRTTRGRCFKYVCGRGVHVAKLRKGSGESGVNAVGSK